ncbi:MAG: uroporphyrinogen III methyltransferase / synthase [Anaerolineaceae bacterium]|nr:MAG: uroporphyrinogen III methyltransferase / synthase [Anaerolineaceae bacterium]
MKVLITRPRSQADSFANALAEIGFEPVYFPVIEIRPVEDLTALDKALSEIGRYAWVVFTSVNGVEVVFDVIARRGTPKQSPKTSGGLLRFTRSDTTLRVAAIGPKTAEALQKRGVTPDFVPEEYVAEAILPGLGDLRGKWVLLPRAEIARKALPKAIAEAGGVAHEIAVYQTVPALLDPDGLAALKSGVNVVTFTSPSTVENFVEIARRAGLDPFHLPGNPKIACIGPITQKAAEEAGFVDLVTAEVYTTEGLVTLLRSGA